MKNCNTCSTWKMLKLLTDTPQKGSPVCADGYLLHVDLEGPQGLTLWTGAWLHLLVLGLEERPQEKVALVTVVLDHAELRQHPCAAGHHSACADQLVQVQLPVEREKTALLTVK